MTRKLVVVAMAVVGLASAPRAAFAQGGALVNASAAAALTNSTTALSYGGGVTYRFNRALGMGVDVGRIQDIDNGNQAGLRVRNPPKGNITSFTTNVRLEIPTTSRHLIPFVVGGGGVANVTQSVPVVYARIAQALGNILPGPSTITSTSINMALTLGGGASILLGDHLSVDADLRVLRLFGDDTRNIGRFGVGVGYRF